ncbi:hypothetical protein EVAR_5055_1 [Eumeta japonica]|uniref:Uncharacterized protein n=1 Tax=Eumeta variegata TaxID=151549 RepID=A0A4C1SUU9_EUMVA|nr:hypothetical protein EVAR_5055_1 [Eumeta japonica]
MKTGIPKTTSCNEHTFSEGQGISELFSQYFDSVFDNSPSSNTNHPLFETNDSIGVFTGFTIAKDDVLKKLKWLDHQKKAEPIGISPIFLKICSEELCTTILSGVPQVQSSSSAPLRRRARGPAAVSGEYCSSFVYSPALRNLLLSIGVISRKLWESDRDADER